MSRKEEEPGETRWCQMSHVWCGLNTWRSCLRPPPQVNCDISPEILSPDTRVKDARLHWKPDHWANIFILHPSQQNKSAWCSRQPASLRDQDCSPTSIRAATVRSHGARRWGGAKEGEGRERERERDGRERDKGGGREGGIGSREREERVREEGREREKRGREEDREEVREKREGEREEKEGGRMIGKRR